MKYIGYFDVMRRDKPMRSCSPAGREKMQYIAETTAKFEPVEIISPSGVTQNETSRGSVTELGDGISLRLFFSLGRKNCVIGKLSAILTKLCFAVYLFFHIRREEKVIVYHSMAYCKLIYWLKKIRKFHLILELEELYSDVNNKKHQKKWELKLAGTADAFIFPTEFLSRSINTKRKPEAIIYGTYRVEPARNCKVSQSNLQRQEKKMIHCVYAGTFDPRKGGALAAAAAAEFLPANYHIHILGFGSEIEIKAMQEHIGKIARKSAAKVTYDGLLTGEEYIRFLQSCDIGLSTQNPDAAFNATSFPSKILSYMANGLRVVSVRIPAIEASAIGSMLYYYDNQTSQQIAKAIMRVNLEDAYDSRRVLGTLDVRCEESLKCLMQKAENEFVR